MPNEKALSDEEQLTDEELQDVSGGTDRFNGKYLVQGVTHPSTQPDADSEGFVVKTKLPE